MSLVAHEQSRLAAVDLVGVAAVHLGESGKRGGTS